MKNTMIGLLAAAALTGVAAADITGLAIEAIEDVEAAGLGFQPYRVYATFDDPADNVVGVTASDVQGTGVFFQSSDGGDIPPIAFLIQLFPELAFDTWVTVGVDVDGQGVVATNGDFTFADDACSGGWENLTPGSGNGQPVNGRVLLGQFTTPLEGELEATLTVAYADGGGDVVTSTVSADSSGGGPGDPPTEPPTGPTNLTLVDQSRAIVWTLWPFENPACFEQLEESFALSAAGFEPIAFAQHGSSLTSSILSPEAPNTIDSSGAALIYMAPGEKPLTCMYQTEFIFDLTFELHEAHAFRWTGFALDAEIGCLEGPDAEVLCLNDDGPDDVWGVLAPGLHRLTSSGFAATPRMEPGFAALFEFHLAVLDHPLDADGSGTIGAADLAALLAAWGACDDCDVDVNGDGFVDAADLAALLSLWGELSWPFELLG